MSEPLQRLYPGRRPVNAPLFAVTVQRCPSCSRTAKQLFYHLTRYTTKDNRYMTAAQSFLALQTEYARETVNRKMQELLSCGHVSTTAQAHDGIPAVYFLHTEAPAKRRSQTALFDDVRTDGLAYPPSGRKKSERLAPLRKKARELQRGVLEHVMAPGLSERDERRAKAAKHAELRRQIEVYGEAAVVALLIEQQQLLASGASPAELPQEPRAEAHGKRLSTREMHALLDASDSEE